MEGYALHAKQVLPGDQQCTGVGILIEQPLNKGFGIPDPGHQSEGITSANAGIHVQYKGLPPVHDEVHIQHKRMLKRSGEAMTKFLQFRKGPRHGNVCLS